MIADGVVYIGDLDGNIYALDLQTGNERWKKKLDTGFTSAAAVRDKQSVHRRHRRPAARPGRRHGRRSVDV